MRSFRRPMRVTGAKTFRILSSAVAESFKFSTSDSSFLRCPIVEFSRLTHHCGWIDVMAFRHCGRFLFLTVRLRTTPHPICYVARAYFCIYMNGSRGLFIISLLSTSVLCHYLSRSPVSPFAVLSVQVSSPCPAVISTSAVRPC